MSDISRRDALRMLGAAPIAGALAWPSASLERATRFAALVQVHEPATPAYAPKFFTAHEWATMRLLSDIIIPRDDRSGSATDAKAPEFIDFMLAEKDTRERTRIAMRGGLAWLDTECRARFGTDFLSSSDAHRHAVLDDIAYPKKARPELARGAAWFNQLRDSVGAAFFSSAMGWQDLRYMGNVFNPGWAGCPQPALDKLGVSYEAFDASLARRRKG